jgi:hypothetical protein
LGILAIWASASASQCTNEDVRKTIAAIIKRLDLQNKVFPSLDSLILTGEKEGELPQEQIDAMIPSRLKN